MSVGALPVGALPVGALPFGALPFGALPFGALPFGALPFGALPFGALPVDALPATTNRVTECSCAWLLYRNSRAQMNLCQATSETLNVYHAVLTILMYHIVLEDGNMNS